MLLFPAIDLFEGKAVRLYKGDYSNMTVYSNEPASVAADFASSGVNYIHIVDLEGAKTGDTPNLDTVLSIKSRTNAFCEVGGGIRSIEVIERYLNAGIDRVILGTAALNDPTLLSSAVSRYGGRIAVGADLKDGYIAIKGWLEKSNTDAESFFAKMQEIGVKTIICTDISRDGAMQGTNLALYRNLSQKYSMQITASGGVSSIDDVKRLAAMNLYGAIIGKAYYTGAINLRQALEVAR